MLELGTFIIGIDPGVTTGLCCLDFYGPGTQDFNVVLCRNFCWNDRREITRYLDRMYYQQGNIIVVIENFLLYENKAREQVGSNFPSVRIIGRVEEGLDRLLILDRMFFQMAGEIAKTIILPHHQEYVDTVKGDQLEHRRDAYKHARTFIVKQLKSKARSKSNANH